MAKAKVNNMERVGFTEVDGTIIPRLIISIVGLEKQGKTHFGLTAPGPIAMFNTDVGEEGVVHKFQDKKIYTMDVGVPAEEESDDADEIFNKFRKGYYAALEDKNIRTLVMDTATELWELLRLARFGKLTQVMPYQYGPVNAEYRRLLRDAYKYDKNVILLHKMKAKYINDKRTAEYERAGFNDTGFLVQLNAQVWRYGVNDGGDFVITVGDSRHNPDMAGEELGGDMCEFKYLASMVMPEVDMEAWE